MAPANPSSEVLEGGSEHQSVSSSAWVALGIVVATLIGLVVGYALGHHHSPTKTAQPPAPSESATPVKSSTAPLGPAFVETGATCSVQHGHRLQLGIQIENSSPSILHITNVVTDEPLPGLRPLATQVGACGQDTGTPVGFDPAAVTSGAATWVTVTVQVLVSCPAPDPVQFVIHYGQGEHNRVEKLGGFNDLVHVAYTGCAHDS